MNTTVNTTDLKETLLSSFKSNQSSLNGNKALQSRKKEALANFEKSGFPTTKNEEWKYTNVSSILKKDFILSGSTSLNKEDIQPFLLGGPEANHIIFLNGIYSKEYSKIVSPESSLIIKNFSDAEPAILEAYFGKLADANKDSFTALNTAFAENGAYIRVPKGKIVEAPVILYFISDARQTDILTQPRNLFLAEENSQIKIIETFNNLGSKASFTNIVTEVIVRQDAIVEYYKIQNESEDGHHVGTTEVLHEGKSIFSSTTVTINGGIIRNNLNIELGAEFCESTLYGLYVLKNKQHVDNHTLVDHAKPNCYSNELYKGILDDKSTGVFNGKINVKPDAQKTNAFQSNKNILLSKDASMNTKPQLEIFADDVKCSHGTTVGQMDEEPLFYLRSRGIREDNAKALLMNAFANDIIEHIKIESLKDKIQHLVFQRLLKD
jgi:Fe-S cluster assembly protein SufD